MKAFLIPGVGGSPLVPFSERYLKGGRNVLGMDGSFSYRQPRFHHIDVPIQRGAACCAGGACPGPSAVWPTAQGCLDAGWQWGSVQHLFRGTSFLFSAVESFHLGVLERSGLISPPIRHSPGLDPFEVERQLGGAFLNRLCT